MDIKYIPILNDALKMYYKDEELSELCVSFDIAYDIYGDSERMKFARMLIAQIEHNNNRRFLEMLVPSLISRSQEGVARSKCERQEVHITMSSNLEELSSSLNKEGLPEEVSVPEAKPFTAKSEVRDLLSSAETDIIIVDNYIGLGTLDCFRDVKQTIHLLTGDRSNSIASGFNSGLRDFISEGYNIEIRQHPKLHDRFIIFNNRCWLVGSSLKDAGRKTFNIIECVDIKDSLISEIEDKWRTATIYTI